VGRPEGAEREGKGGLSSSSETGGGEGGKHKIWNGQGSVTANQNKLA